MPRGTGRPPSAVRTNTDRQQGGGSYGGSSSNGYHPGAEMPPSYGMPVGRNGRPRPYRPGQLDSAYVAAFRPQRRRKPWGVIVLVVLLLALVGGGVAWGITTGALPEAISNLSTLLPGEASHDDDAAADVAAPDSDFAALDEAAAPAVSESIVMTLDGAADTYVLVGEDFLDGGCHAYDTAARKPLTAEATGTVDTQTPGDYTITYTATDEDGAQATATRTVHVVESFDAFDGKAETLAVLMYHYIYAEDDSPAEEDANYLLDTKFEKHLQYLTEHHYYYPSFAEVRAFAEGTHTLPARSVVLTFDDAQDGFLKYGTPLLNQYQVPGTSFMICSKKKSKAKIAKYMSPYVQFQSHSYDLHERGTDEGKGGIIHAKSVEELEDDLKRAQKILGTTEAFAYPFGDTDEDAEEALANLGVLCAFTVENTRVEPGNNPLTLPRVRIAGEYTQEGFEYLVEPNGGEQ